MTRYTEWSKEKLEETLGWSITSLGLSVRTTNRLDDRGILTIGDLLYCTKADLMGIPNFGGKAYEEVMNALKAMGFY